MRLALYMLGVAIVSIGLAVSYFTRETLISFNPFPASVPLKFIAGYEAEQAFTVGYGGTYEIEFDVENPTDLRPFQYSAWDAVIETSELHWEVVAGRRKVAGGRSSAYPENSYSRAGGSSPPRSGRVIGQFTADEGTRYLVRIQVLDGDPKLNSHDPRINVTLNGQELSDLSNVDEVREITHRGSGWSIAVGLGLLGIAVLLQVFGRTPPAA
jgi:hypothetical protein